jgi:hypothetical protein
MASLLRLFRKSLKRGSNIVRRVGKGTRKAVRKGTNTIGLTKKRRGHRGRKH